MKLKVLLVLIGYLSVAAWTLPAVEVPSDDSTSFRLPNNTRPLHYYIILETEIHRGDFDFAGRVEIRIEALENTSEITLNYRQIRVDYITLYSTSEEGPIVIQSGIVPELNEALELITIPLEEELIANEQYIIELSYYGVLRDDNFGFYRSSYRGALGEQVWLATTQFQPHHARSAFPCYDEPQIRATFSIEIIHHSSYFALSNMPVASLTTPIETERTYTVFETTPAVQTYLVAFVVSNFVGIENTNASRVPQSVFAKPSAIALGHADFGLELGELFLEEFGEHFNMPYSLPKIDQAAIPDSAWGASWGICTSREETLLYNQELGDSFQRAEIVRLVAHEYLHQWFGNLVAPQWWDVIWLNEGFAALYESFLPNIVYPPGRHMHRFVTSTIHSALEFDAGPGSRPMTQYVESPEAAGVLRMMQVAFGPDTWNKGISFYLEANQYSVATPTDLYTALQRAVDEDLPAHPVNVATVMESWEHQAGFPVMSVSHDGSWLIFSQSQFSYTGEESENLWWVPVNYVAASNPNFTETGPDFWMEGESTVTLSSATAPKPFNDEDWIVVNIQETGFYRVNYDADLWNSIIEHLEGDNFDDIHLVNRAQLIDDSSNLARAQLTTYGVAFGILDYLHKEFDFVPWSAANRGLTLLNRWLEGTAAYPNYQAFVRRIVQPLYDLRGFEYDADEPVVDRFARVLAINLACEAGIENCQTETASLLNSHVVNGTTIDPDVRGAIFCNGLRQSDYNTFIFLRDRMLQSDYQGERTLILDALGCANDVAALTEFLHLAVAPGNSLHLVERTRMLTAPVSSGEVGLRVMMNFVGLHFRAVNNVAQGQVNSMLSAIAIRVVSETVFDEFDSLLVNLIEQNVISEDNGNSFRASANQNFEWQTRFVEEIAQLINNDGTVVRS